MAIVVTMPKLGLTMTEGVVVKWHKKEGDAVKKGDELFEVETDKLTNLVEADCEGIVLRIAVQEGVSVECGAPVAYIGNSGETFEEVGGASAAPAENPASDPKPEESVLAKPSDTAERSSGGYVLATPAAKELAKEKGIDIASVPATGPNKSVVLKDVEAFEGDGAKSSGLAAKIAAELGVDITTLSHGKRVMSDDVLRAALSVSQDTPTDTKKPLSGMRKTIARRMSESWHVSPRVCYEMAVDCTEMIALREKLKKPFEEKDLKLTYNHVIIKACAQALREFPEINASVDGDKLLLHPCVNIGLAVGVDNGLLVPNIKNCGNLGLADISAAAEDMIKRARKGELAMEELSGGTFTITNIGMYGMRSFSPIINQPELAILGVNSMAETPVVRNGSIVIRTMMNLNLVADHRAIDGVLAAKFFSRVVSLLETPALMLM